LPDDAWARGKSALKSVQYLACGVPFVASPVGAAAAVGCRGRTHMAAEDPSEWRLALFHLLDNPAARAEMGRQGRQYALEHHTTAIGADLLGQALRKAAG
jgi:glycosyltransferase involved in cell wall biosynthesis